MKRVLIGPIAARTREILRQIAMENEVQIISGKISVDHIKYVYIIQATTKR